MDALEVLQPVIDRIVPVAFERGLDALTRAERNVFLVWSYPAAINDGGHASFFYNSHGQYAQETVEALKEVGSSEHSGLLSRAIQLFPGGRIPRDIQERNRVLDQLPDETTEKMEALDREFFALGDDELLTRLAGYWNQNAG